MRTLNQTGSVFILFIFFSLTFAAIMVASVAISKIVFQKMKLAGALDRGTFAAASYMTEIMNEWVLENKKAHQQFLELEQEFKETSQPTEEKARDHIRNLWVHQNELYDKMEEKTATMLEVAYKIAESELQKEIPTARLIPLYAVAPIIMDGPKKDFSFDKINGAIIFDPTGHQKFSKTKMEARIAFLKDPSQVVAFAAGAEMDLSHWKSPMRAVSAGQPFGGSVWSELFYQTAMVPVASLPKSGFIKNENPNWRDFEPNAIQH